MDMQIRNRLVSLAIVAVTASALLAGTHGVAQAPPAKAQAPAAAPVPATPAPSEKDVAILQKELIELLRQTPKLTLVVERDPTLLSNQEYVQRYNPRLADFLTAHPDVAKNPDYYLFNRLNRDGVGTDDVLERAVWPEMYSGRRERTSWDELASDIPPTIGIGSFLLAFLWTLRLFVENRRWSRIFSLQNQVHSKLIDKFSSSQELAAYMETEAGKRFLEAAPIPVGIDSGQRVPNTVARVLTPIQIGVVLVLLGIGFLMLRHAGPDMETPMLVLGTVILMPGIGFIISAGITWVLAARLGLMPSREQSAIAPTNRFDAPFGNSDRS
jgi:hypothetical protein